MFNLLILSFGFSHRSGGKDSLNAAVKSRLLESIEFCSDRLILLAFHRSNVCGHEGVISILAHGVQECGTGFSASTDRPEAKQKCAKCFFQRGHLSRVWKLKGEGGCRHRLVNCRPPLIPCSGRWLLMWTPQLNQWTNTYRQCTFFRHVSTLKS